MDSSRCALWNLGFHLSIPENDIENEEMPQQVRSAQQDCTVAHGTKQKCHDSRWRTNYLSHIIMLYHGNAPKKRTNKLLFLSAFLLTLGIMCVTVLRITMVPLETIKKWVPSQAVGSEFQRRLARKTQLWVFWGSMTSSTAPYIN